MSQVQPFDFILTLFRKSMLQIQSAQHPFIFAFQRLDFRLGDSNLFLQ